MGRRAPRTPGVAVLVGFHLVVVALLVALNPFGCIYAFMGYLDGERFLARRWSTLTVVLTSLLMAVGQSGGVDGARALPALWFGLSIVNVVVALAMLRAGRRREADVAVRERAVAALAAAQAENADLHQRLLIQAREAGITEERARLSREIHDTVAQGLVAVVRQLEAVTVPLDTDTRARLDRATESARSALVDARRAVVALAPYELDGTGLPAALARLSSGWSDRTGLDVSLDVDTVVPGQHDGVLLRIAQEALANVARHADAGRVTITVRDIDDSRVLSVHDDGHGFAPDAIKTGHGLTSMAERCAAVGGELVVDGSAGTTVSAVVPR